MIINAWMHQQRPTLWETAFWRGVTTNLRKSLLMDNQITRVSSPELYRISMLERWEGVISGASKARSKVYGCEKAYDARDTLPMVVESVRVVARADLNFYVISCMLIEETTVQRRRLLASLRLRRPKSTSFNHFQDSSRPDQNYRYMPKKGLIVCHFRG